MVSKQPQNGFLSSEAGNDEDHEAATTAQAALCTTPMLNAKLNGSSNAIRVKTTEASGTTTSSGVRIVPKSKKHLKVTQCAVLFIILVLIALLCSVFIRPQIFLSDCRVRNVCLTAQCVQTAAYLLSAMDRNADPCHDFFQYACGSWNRKHVIPEDRSSISTFEVMADQLQVILKGILDKGQPKKTILPLQRPSTFTNHA